MFESSNNHLVHKEAVSLISKSLPGSVSLDNIYGYHSPYHIEWNGLKLLVKVARQAKKKRTETFQSGEKYKWFYALREKDHKIADFFILLCLSGNKLEAIYTIPRVFSPKYYITITNLNGNMRYDYFRTTPQGLSTKIMEIKNNLPKLAKIYREVKELDKR